MTGEESRLPAGTVTFLFTDVERSTESASALGDERWAEALQTHRDLLRPAFEKHGGVEVGTEGDAFFVAFVRATDAVDAAVDGQRALERHDWPGETRLRVRMGMHTGEALVRGDDYVGHEIHRAKRISDAGHGAQILLSQTTADLVGGVVALTDLGPHRLKDLAESERIFQVHADDLPTDFPPLRSLESFRTNLPVQRSSFVGREAEIVEVRKLLENNRLVTLSGVGGCGKTRLALQAGAEEVDRFPDGVFFVEFAPVSDPDLIARTVAGAIGLPMASLGEVSVGDLDQLVLEHLTRQNCLLVLDNCEHLLDACAALADQILGRCPRVRLLVTSREGLDVEGEQSYTVPSLSLPESDADVQNSEAVSLFKARAQSALPRFELTPGNIGDVVDVCRRLDGIPLAIELAASRVTHLSPRQIAERLDDLFRELTGGRRRVQRQQTLQATLDWSYELLDEHERILLARLAVFAGTFGLEAVEGICADDAGRTVELLASLVSKSLVVAEPQEDFVRYRLLEPVRLYAAGKLRELGEGETLRSRHRDWFLAWLEAVPQEDAAFEPEVVSMLERDLDNLRAAMEWSDRENRPDLVGRLAAANTFGLIFFRFHYDEFHRWLLRAVEVPERLDPELRAACYAALAFTATMRADGTNLPYFYRATAIDVGANIGVVTAAKSLAAVGAGTIAWMTGKDEDAAAARRAAEEAQNLPELVPGWRGFARVISGMVEILLGDYAKACDDSAAVVDELGPRFPSIRLQALSNLAVAAHLAGRDRPAFEAADELIRMITGPGASRLPFGPERLSVAEATPAIAAGGEAAWARSYLRTAVEEAARYRVPLVLNAMLVCCAAVEAVARNYDRATRLLGAARWTGGIDRLQIRFRDPGTAVLYRHYVGVVREKLGPEEALRGRDEGRAMSPDEAVAYALDGLDN